MYTDLPLEVWSRVVTHANPVEIGALYDVSAHLRQEVMKHLQMYPTTIEQAMKADVPILMRTAICYHCSDFEIRMLVDLAYAEKAWRVLVHCFAPMLPEYCCPILVRGGYFGQAALIVRSCENADLDTLTYWILQLYMTSDIVPREQVLYNILRDCDDQGSHRLREYVERVHPRDVLNLIQKALNEGYPRERLCDITRLNRRKVIQYYLLQSSLGKSPSQ